MDVHEVKVNIGGKDLTIQTGKLAKQANAAALISYGDSVLLVTATASNKPTHLDYFPLTVDFEEKMYAAGKIPGGFIKRESRASEHATLSARQIDRPIRPLFPKDFKNEIQVIALALSSDMENPLDVCGIVGASTALSISDIPWDGPVSGVRVARVAGEFIINPTFEQQAASDINLVVAGSDDSLCMVEGDAVEATEADMLKALEKAHESIRLINAVQRELIAKCGKPKMTYEPVFIEPELIAQVEEFALARMKDALDGKMKEEREEAISALLKEAQEKFALEGEAEGKKREKDVSAIVHDLEGRLVRESIIERGIRPDGRALTEVRPISSEVGLLPRTHGSALFTRGQTQVLSSVTLGTLSDKQRIDGISDDTVKHYIHHYNFPPFSVGEVRPMRGPSRRDIGHGALAERAILAIMPSDEVFPYTIRVVSEVLESNGSSSMASVCGSTLSLMDAGVPLKAPVAGIAMGLVMNPDGRYKILTDIQGVEDHLGDMDFKVAGTAKGINAVQMDIKVKGVTSAVMAEALEDAKNARLFILGKMRETLSEPKPDLSVYAPRVFMLDIDVEKIGAVIGPGGKIIRHITEVTGARIDVEETGRVLIYSVGPQGGQEALDMVKAIVEDVEVGKEYTGTVTRITSFGAFMEILPGKEGLVHISNIANWRIGAVEDVLKMGQKVKCAVREIDDMGRVNLTMKGLNPGIDKTPEELAAMGGGGEGDERSDRGPRRDGDRPPRRDDRGGGGYRGGGDRGGDRPPRRDGGGGGGYRGGGDRH